MSEYKHTVTRTAADTAWWGIVKFRHWQIEFAVLWIIWRRTRYQLQVNNNQHIFIWKL